MARVGNPDALEHVRAIAFAPIIHARPDTVGRFSDVPVFTWYEVEPTTAGERYRYRYSLP